MSKPIVVFLLASSTLLSKENEAKPSSRISIVYPAVSQSTASLVNVQLVAPKKNVTRLSGSLKLTPCSDVFPAVLTSMLSTVGDQGCRASKIPCTTEERSPNSFRSG